MSAAATGAQAAAAALLSRWWSRPEAGELDAWEDAWPLARTLARELGAGEPGVDELWAACRTAGTEELLDEYERLFVGPGRTPCPPYESLWTAGEGRSERGHLGGATSAAVAGLYRRLGLDVSASARELADHVAIEWEALAHASRSDEPDAEPVADALLAEHLVVWLPSFCEAVERHAQLAYYGALARLTRTWVQELGGVAAGP